MNTNHLTLEGPLISEYRRVSDRADIACEISQRERIARNAGRRESDREIEALRDKLRLAANLLSEAIGYAQGKPFTAQQMTALEIGLEVIRG